MSGQWPAVPGSDPSQGRGLVAGGGPSQAELAALDASARRGYFDAGFLTNSALEAFDMELEPFDVMTSATLVYPPSPAGTWTDVAVWAMPGGQYGVLRHIGVDCNDPTAYQRVSWRIMRNSRGMGGDVNGLIPALEARCGILDGGLMPFRIFIPPGGYVQLQAQLQSAPPVGEAIDVVRGRLQGERRNAYGVRS